MKTLRIAFGLWGACALAVSQAAPQELGDLIIDMPAVFQGPQVSTPMPNAKVYGYAVETAAIPKPVVMIIVRENDNPAAELKPEDVLPAEKKLAAEMLAATARRRTEFQATEPREIKLAGLPAVDIEWTGKANDMATSGRLFVVVSGSTAYFFQVMGAGPPTRDMIAAVEAVKGMRRKQSM